ncbi:tetratricopeptide repeat protein [Anaeromyxobacter oryzae]|uniref:Beta-lactamase n=1 Tax=Anaeromyxobacter oryzae TaxID=2918170 RepID=A0ABN6MSG3_9BACT|nr:sel1 repeat family protein [Anaeromyxobacter oryzae]BDG03220.1 hypothetical protein AMOR_22160 [Anaeromyxobacter oryzae]
MLAAFAVSLVLVAAPAPPASACDAHARLLPRAPAPAGGAPGCAHALAEVCDAGSPRACEALGEALEGTEGLPADPARARALHARACRAGLGDACGRLAALLLAGGDPAGAAAAREDGCALGAPRACAALAGTVADPARAAALRERACDLGDGAACLAVARGDAARGPALLERACRLGEGDACAERADRGAPDAARTWLERGCAAESEAACARLGIALLADRGGGAGRGADLLRGHCAALGPAACLDAASRWLGGPSAVIDDASAPALVEAACDRGVLDACARLGRLVQEGREVPGDGRRAAALYARACDGGVARACADLGVLHRFGAGVPRDEGRAGALLDRACRLGLDEGCFLRDDPVRPSDAAAGGSPSR